MAARNFEQLTKYRARLVKEMQCKSVVEELLSAGVLLRAHEDQITEYNKRDDQVRELIKILPTRGAGWFEKFLQALHDTDQYTLENLLKYDSESAPTDVTATAQASGGTDVNVYLQSPLMECQAKIAERLDLTEVVPYFVSRGRLKSLQVDKFKPLSRFNYENNLEFIELLDRQELMEIFLEALIYSNQRNIARDVQLVIDQRRGKGGH